MSLPQMKTTAKLWLGIAVLVILSPLGLILPEYFKATGAWGEWGIEDLGKIAGYIPRGLEKLSGLWNAPLPDYAFRNRQGCGILFSSITYILSATAGIIVTVIIVLIIGRILAKKRG